MKTIVIYPGNFQPPHKGHAMVYKQLQKLAGLHSDVFVALTSGTPTEHAPLNVSDKELIWVRHGVPASHIIKVSNWKTPKEIFEKYSKANTAAIFALNAKEISDLHPRKQKVGHVQEETEDAPVDPNKEVWMDASGKLSYFQPYEGNEGHMEPFEKHSYVKEIDDSQIDGNVWSTSNVRQALGSQRYTPEQKKKVFAKIFGWFDIGLFNILNQKFKMASQTASPDEMPALKESKQSGRQQLRNMVRECLKQMLEGSLDGGGTLGGNEDDTPDMASSLDKSDAEKTKDQVDTTNDLIAQKKTAEMEKDQHDAQGKRDQISYLNYRKLTQPNDRETIDNINQQIATAKKMPSM